MYRPSLARLALAALIGALGSLGQSEHDIRNSVRPRGWRNPLRGIFASNKFTPHQGPREMARRRGGRDWLTFKMADRETRGLPPQKAA